MKLEKLLRRFFPLWNLATALVILFVPSEYGVKLSGAFGWMLAAYLSWRLEQKFAAIQIIVDDSVQWNPFNQVVQSHRTGEMVQPLTDQIRKLTGLCSWAEERTRRASLERLP